MDCIKRTMTYRAWQRLLYRPQQLMILAFSACLLILAFSWWSIDVSSRQTISDKRLADYYLRVKTKSPLADDQPINFPVLPPVFKEQPTLPTPLDEQDVIKNSATFVETLNNKLSEYPSDLPVILSIIDYGFMDMAINFIKISIEKQGMENVFLPVCLDETSASTLQRYGYKCVLLEAHAQRSMQASDFGTDDYYKKTNIKTWVMLQALRLSRSVLLSDVDIAYFKNPFPFFNCTECDIHIQMDKQLYNSGFVFARPTNVSVSLYQQAWDFYLQYHKGHDQAYINMAITAMKKEGSIRVISLSWREFPCGAYYFEHEYRHFNNEPRCERCVIAHNNYLGTTAAKIYRFKENHLWAVDHSGYYSNPQAKYITYENPYDFGDKTREVEIEALKKAVVLAQLMRRILVLPSFRCCNCRTKTCDHPFNRCSLLSILNVKSFDGVFSGEYREHSFLDNQVVPIQVTSFMSPWLHIQKMNDTSDKAVADISQYVFKDTDLPEKNGRVLNFPSIEITADNLKKYLEKFSSFPVIRLHSLYLPMDYSEAALPDGSLISNLFDIGLECGLYEQWEHTAEEKFFGKLAH